MKLLSSKIALFLFAALLVSSACAQDKAKPVAPKPVLGPSQGLLWAWNDIGRKLTAMAEDFPEDKYDFKPNPIQRSFAEQLIHAANGIYTYNDLVRGVKPHLDDPKRTEFKNKAAVVEYVRKAYADGAALLAAKGDKGIDDLIVDPWSNQQFRVSEEAWFFVEHSGEHYGQLVVYYRVVGLVPPESRPKK
jgi:uncharacterized damage-inducible protein DinB